MQELTQKTLTKPKIKIWTKLKNLAKTSVILSIFIVFLMILMIFKPNLCISSIYNGLSIWAKCVVPSLLPFMFFTKLLTDLKFIDNFASKTAKINKFLFNAPKISGYIFLMSLISGYPVGAKLISEYHKMGAITTNQANKLCTFCSTSGPIFIIGSVGTAMFLNAKLGYIMFISHILGVVLNGILYRKAFVDRTEIPIKTDEKTQISLQNTMKDSILSVLIVGGFISIAFLIIDLLNDINALWPINFVIDKICSLIGIKDVGSAISSGFLEVSKGASMLAKLGVSYNTLGTIASFLIGFGGISIFLQAVTFLKNAQVNLKFYFMQKLTQGILSGIVCFLICVIFKI